GDLLGLFARGRRLLEHDERDDRLARSGIGTPHDRGFGHELVRHQRRLDLGAAQAVPGYAQHVVGAAQNPEVAVFVALGVVAGQIHALELAGEIAGLVPVFVAPYRTDHGRPGAPDDQQPAGTGRQLVTRLVDHCGVDTGQRQRAGTGLEGRGTRQWRKNMPAGFGLPPRVDHGAARTAHVLEVPDPRLGVDGFAHRTEQSQTGQVVVARMVVGVLFRRLDERADCRGRRIENGDLVTLDHLPEATRIRIRGNAFEDDLGEPGSERAVGDVGVAGDPADVGRAPEDVVGFG